MRRLLWFLPKPERQLCLGIRWSPKGINWDITFPDHYLEPSAWFARNWKAWASTTEEKLVIVSGYQSSKEDFSISVLSLSSFFMETFGKNLPKGIEFLFFWNDDSDGQRP